MRITKATQEYISSRVEERLIPHYAEKKALAKEQKDKEAELIEQIAQAVDNLAKDMLHQAEASGNYDFLSFDCNRKCVSFNTYLAIDLDSKVQHWYQELQEEKKKATLRIVATLEMGGTMDDLERMLDELN